MKTQSLSFLLAAILITGCGGGDNSTTDREVESPGAQKFSQSEVPAVYRSRLDIVKQTELPFRGLEGLAADTILNGHTLTSLSNSRLKLDMRSLPQGWYTGIGSSTLLDGSGVRVPTHIRSYQGFYSGVYIQEADEGLDLHMNYGVEPLSVDLPSSGKAIYKGIAFDVHDRGTFTYHLDFGSKQGRGSITGIRKHGDINLHPSTFTRIVQDDYVVFQTTNGRATGSNGDFLHYNANVWGPGGAEINGRVQHFGKTTTVFQGTRDAFSP